MLVFPALFPVLFPVESPYLDIQSVLSGRRAELSDGTVEECTFLPLPQGLSYARVRAGE